MLRLLSNLFIVLVLSGICNGLSHYSRVKRGGAYAGGYNDFSGVAKMSTFASLGAYGGFTGHNKASGGYAPAGGGAGGISVPGALGAYGGYNSGHGGPTVLSSGGYGNGGLLFGKI